MKIGASMRVSDKFPREVAADTRRISGVTPNVTRAFAEQPWRYLKKGSMGRLAGGGGMKRGNGAL